MRAEIDYRLAGNSYRYILLPKRSYAELRDKLHGFARLGILPIYRVMRWRELTQFLTPAKVSYDRKVYKCKTPTKRKIDAGILDE